MYTSAVLRVLAGAGPKGATASEIASQAVALGFETWDPTATNVKNGITRKTKHEAVAMLPGYRYALKCMPGVVDHRPASKAATPKPDGNAAGGGRGGDALVKNEVADLV